MQKTSERYLRDIALRKIFGGNCVTVTNVMYNLSSERDIPPLVQVACTPMQGRSNLESMTSPALLQVRKLMARSCDSHTALKRLN